MPKTIQVIVHDDQDERHIQTLAACLRANDKFSLQIRDFADTVANDQHPQGISFQPKPGQILICHFGLAFRQPEINKTRPVLVISAHQRSWTRVCTVMPISSKAPHTVEPYHYRLPDGLLPKSKYPESWLKGDLIVSVADHRLDRMKTGFRKYETPTVSPEVLKEARRCALHRLGMHSLTIHW
ncbi:type II toxin-antitoxin system PemK/MazF family toxin [Methylocystis sp.]|uniref:type II toxin-antitoxin system PemK/MazF family toxin n=1 Tax=Methylocystis sp. TaxID=1911079 RepID=UPI003DA6393B